jgi:hypothetical protein
MNKIYTWVCAGLLMSTTAVVGFYVTNTIIYRVLPYTPLFGVFHVDKD